MHARNTVSPTSLGAGTTTVREAHQRDRRRVALHYTTRGQPAGVVRARRTMEADQGRREFRSRCLCRPHPTMTTMPSSGAARSSVSSSSSCPGWSYKTFTPMEVGRAVK